VIGEGAKAIWVGGGEFTYPLYLIREYTTNIEDDGDPELIRAALEISDIYHVDRWFGRGMNEIKKMEFVKHYNKTIRKPDESKFKIYSAPNSESESLDYHMNIIRSCIHPGEIILNWTLSTRFALELGRIASDLQNKNISDIRNMDYPMISAVGYALSALRTRGYTR
jgi:hypothetical protein